MRPHNASAQAITFLSVNTSPRKIIDKHNVTIGLMETSIVDCPAEFADLSSVPNSTAASTYVAMHNTPYTTPIELYPDMLFL